MYSHILIFNISSNYIALNKIRRGGRQLMRSKILNQSGGRILNAEKALVTSSAAHSCNMPQGKLQKCNNSNGIKFFKTYPSV